MQANKIKLEYFTDVLCVWAYTAQIRLDELQAQFKNKIDISYHFLPIFSCTETRVIEGWKDKGGLDAFSKHIQSVCAQFPHVNVHNNIWCENVPKTSASVHLYFKAIQLLENNGQISREPVAEFNGKSVFEEYMWRTRVAFFSHARNIALDAELLNIANELNLPVKHIQFYLSNGEAMAALCRDIELKDKYAVEGSPTYLLNEGRQKLYGNVGYKIIEANLHEVLEKPQNQASWC